VTPIKQAKNNSAIEQFMTHEKIVDFNRSGADMGMQMEREPRTITRLEELKPTAAVEGISPGASLEVLQ
jgi:predicted methyltransferase